MQFTRDNYKRLSAAIGDALEFSIHFGNAESISRQLLDSFLDLTEGDCGFIGVIHEPNHGQTVLKLQAIACRSVNREVIDSMARRVAAEFQSPGENRPIATGILAGEPIVVNDPADPILSTGPGAESSPLSSFMGLPLQSPGQLVGMVGVARIKPGFSEEWADFLDPLLKTCGRLFGVEANDREQHLQAILEGGPAGIVTSDLKTGRIRFSNTRWLEMTGAGNTGEEPAFGPRFWADPNAREQVIDKLRQEGQAVGETRLLKSDGEQLPVMFTCQYNPGQRKEVLWWVVDISERKKTQERLRLQEMLLEQILENLPVGVFCKDINNDLQYTVYNRKCEELFGMAAENVLGKSNFDFLPHDRAQEVREDDLEIIRTDRIMLIPERRIDTDDGETFFVRIMKLCVHDSNGKPNLIVGTAEDITDQREIEKSLQTSEERFRQLAANAPVGIFLTDPSGACIYVNDHWQRMAGLSQDEADGVGWQSAVHKGDVAEMEAAWQRFITGESEFSLEYRFVRPDGALTWVSGTAVTFRNYAGQVIGFLGCATDITEHKQFERELRHSRDEAQHANEAKSEFLSRMSHELRTPLNAILGFGQLLQMKNQNLTDNQVEGVNQILAGGEHLLELIEDVLDLSRIETGHLSLSLKKVSTAQVLQRSVYMVESLADSSRVIIELPVGDIPEAVADSRRLQQVLVNLLTNAIKYNRVDGTVNVMVTRQPENKVRISVTDTGLGIREDDQARLFEPFERIGEHNMMIEGTGIGLSICKKLMNMMGGQIGFESEFGVGSTFWIDLLAGMESEASETLGKHVNMLRQAARLKGIRILYVEDHMASIRLMSEVTQIIPDCEFIVATNAPDGVALAKSVRPDLILLDINLPGPQGFDALEQLKNDKRTRKIPVIAVSATATKATIERGKKAGLDDFLSKPLYLEQLFRAIDSVYR